MKFMEGFNYQKLIYLHFTLIVCKNVNIVLFDDLFAFMRYERDW